MNKKLATILATLFLIMSSTSFADEKDDKLQTKRIGQKIVQFGDSDSVCLEILDKDYGCSMVKNTYELWDDGCWCQLKSKDRAVGYQIVNGTITSVLVVYFGEAVNVFIDRVCHILEIGGSIECLEFIEEKGFPMQFVKDGYFVYIAFSDDGGIIGFMGKK